MKYRMLIIPVIFSFLLVFGLSLAVALDDYNYSMRIDLENTGSTEISGPFTFEIDAETLVNGHYIQADADDVIISTASGTENLCAMALASGTASWRLMPLSIPAYASEVRTLYFGDTTATRDQRWISSSSDTCTVSDDNTLDFDTEEFLLQAELFLSGTPSAEQPIIAKDGNYELVVTGSPNFVFRVWASGTSSEVSIPATVGQDLTLQAWIVDDYMSISDGSSIDGITSPGSLSVNSNDLDLSDYIGTINNALIAVK
jgi:hypothetical protein